MKKERNYGSMVTLNEIIMYFILTLFLGYCIFPGAGFFYSDGCRIMVAILFFTLVLVNIKKIMTASSKMGLMLFAMLLWALMAIFINGESLNPFTSIVQFLSCITVYSCVGINRRQLNILMLVISLIWLVFVINSFSVWQKYTAGISAAYNPNVIGLGIALSYMFLSLLFSARLKRKYVKVLILLVLFSMSIYCIYLSQCRTALTVALVFPVLMLFKRFAFKHRLIIISLTLFVGMVFPLVYLNMYNNGLRFESSIMTEKSLYSGRQALWSDALFYIGSSEFGWMVGVNGNSDDYELSASNLHNWPLSVYFSFGIPFMLLYFVFFVNAFYRVRSEGVCVIIILLSAIGWLEACAGARNITQIFMMFCFMLQDWIDVYWVNSFDAKESISVNNERDRGKK